MKYFFSRVLVALIGLSGFQASIFAADATATPGKIHHFTISAPASAKVWEAIDVTVEARDKDDKVLTNYRGSIFFQSDTDFGATIPAQGKAIQFKESDNGILKISKGVIFKRVGNQELTVTEALEDVGGSIKIRIEDGSGATPVVTPESITITTPEKGSTITSNSVMMSGKTKKNSKVLIKLNGKEIWSAQSNEDGIFIYNLTGIDQQSNALSASVVDGSNAVIGTVDSQFNFWAKTPTYYNLSISPAKEVDVGTGITLLVDAEPGLSDVMITLDGASLTAKEQSPGKYSITTVSPAKAGTYPIQVTLKNILSQTTAKPDAGTLTVKEAAVIAPPPPPPQPKAAFKDVKVTTEEGRINMNFFVENLPANTVQFKIAYGENANSLSSEVMTLPLEKIRRSDGSYNWYIDKLEPKTYSFKIFAVQSGWILVPDLSSESMSAVIGKTGCSIGNIGDIQVATSSDKTVLSWAALTGAISYNIYRVMPSQDYELIKNVTENSYVIYLSSGSLVYQDFAVKALCDDKTESKTPAVASKVQTGPGLLTALVILSSLLGIIILRRRNA
jgi:hypothetical protein